MHINQLLLRSPLGDAGDHIRRAVFARRSAVGSGSGSGASPTGPASGDLAGAYPAPTVFQAHLTDQAVPATPPAGTLILYSFNKNGFSVPRVEDPQGNAIGLTRDNVFVSRNISGVTIAQGSPVYITGANGNVPTVAMARADSTATMPAVGVMYDTTPNNSFGRVMSLGNLENFNLSAFAVGAALWVSPTVAGGMTSVRPGPPNMPQLVGVCLNNGLGNGVMQVRPGLPALGYADAAGGELAGTYPNPQFRLPDIRAPGGRLSLRSGVWLSTTDDVGATLYYTPGQTDSAGHNRIAIFDGAYWQAYAFAELSLAVPATQWRLFDVYIYDNAGTLTLETANWSQKTGVVTAATNASPIQITSAAHGLANGDTVQLSGLLGNTGANGGGWNVQVVDANNFTLSGSVGTGAWTSGGTWWQLNGSRVTALATRDGVLVKAGASTRRYLGTGMTNGTAGQCQDAVQNRLLFNAYNRAVKVVAVQGVGHTYAINYRRYNNNDPTLHIKIVFGLATEFVLGLFGQLTGSGTARAQTLSVQDGDPNAQDNIISIPAQTVNASTLTYAPNTWTPGCHFLSVFENAPDSVSVGIGISGIRAAIPF
jgi:hypothetical protein